MSPLMILKEYCDNCAHRKTCPQRMRNKGAMSYSIVENCGFLLDEYNRIIDGMDKKEEKEMVNHPSHYNRYPIETIDMMVAIFGKEATRQWCLMTAYKYRMRLGLKDDILQDLEKEQWYLNKAKELE